MEHLRRGSSPPNSTTPTPESSDYTTDGTGPARGANAPPKPGGVKERRPQRSHLRSQSQSVTNLHSAPASPGKLMQPEVGTSVDALSLSGAAPGSMALSNFTENLKGLFSGSLSSLTSAAQYMGSVSSPSSAMSGAYQNASAQFNAPGLRRTSGNIVGASRRSNSSSRDKCKTLLIIDEPHTDWSKYFKGRRLNNEWDIRLEQAEFKEINLAAYTDEGAIVDMQLTKNGTRVVRSFKPDFVLIRQYVKDARDDWTNILLGLIYGNVPSLNSLESIYNFQNKPRVFADLIKIQKKIGKEQFPLIDQAYYPNYKEMMITPKFPIVVKIGHSHSGNGKIKIDNHYDFQDITSIIAVTNCYSVIESFVDSKYDIHIQKIGTHYKAFMRKSITGNWKANMGSSMLEEIPVNEKYKLWVDECAKLYGGLDIVAVEALKSKDGREIIFQVNDSAMNLLGESQEENRQHIADLTIEKMEELFDQTKRDSLCSEVGAADKRKGSSGSSKIRDPRYSLPHQQTLKQSSTQDLPSRVDSDGGMTYTSREMAKSAIIPVGDLSDSSSDNMTPASSIKSGTSFKAGTTNKKTIPTSYNSVEDVSPQAAGRQPPPVPPHPKVGASSRAHSSTSLTPQNAPPYNASQSQASQRYPGQQHGPAPILTPSVFSGGTQGPPAQLPVGSNQAAFRYPGQSPMRAQSQVLVGRQSAGGTQMRTQSPLESRDHYDSRPASSVDPRTATHGYQPPPNATNREQYNEPEARHPQPPRTGSGMGMVERMDSKDIVGDTMGNLRKTFAGIFGDM